MNSFRLSADLHLIFYVRLFTSPLRDPDQKARLFPVLS